MRKERMALMCAALVFGLAACGGDGGTSVEESVAGIYALRTVNGGSLPAVVLQAGSDKLEVTAGHVQINEDGTASDSYTYRLTEAGGISTDTESDVGTWTVQGNNLRVAWAAGSVETFAWQDDTLTMTDQGMTLVYRR